jgi:hypothetical protein
VQLHLTAHGLAEIIDALTLHGLVCAVVKAKLSKPKS